LLLLINNFSFPTTGVQVLPVCCVGTMGDGVESNVVTPTPELVDEAVVIVLVRDVERGRDGVTVGVDSRGGRVEEDVFVDWVVLDVGGVVEGEHDDLEGESMPSVYVGAIKYNRQRF
jgi:hypothetical protein